MFWEAMVYGAGASIGACVGLFLFTLLVGMLLRDSKSTNRKLAEESLEALLDRNRLMTSMFSHLQTIAAAIERGRGA